MKWLLVEESTGAVTFFMRLASGADSVTGGRSKRCYGLIVLPIAIWCCQGIFGLFIDGGNRGDAWWEKALARPGADRPPRSGSRQITRTPRRRSALVEVFSRSGRCPALDVFLNSPISALRFVALPLRRTASTPRDTRFARLDLGLSTKSIDADDFLRVHQRCQVSALDYLAFFRPADCCSR